MKQQLFQYFRRDLAAAVRRELEAKANVELSKLEGALRTQLPGILSNITLKMLATFQAIPPPPTAGATAGSVADPLSPRALAPSPPPVQDFDFPIDLFGELGDQMTTFPDSLFYFDLTAAGSGKSPLDSSVYTSAVSESMYFSNGSTNTSIEDAQGDTPGNVLRLDPDVANWKAPSWKGPEEREYV